MVQADNGRRRQSLILGSQQVSHESDAPRHRSRYVLHACCSHKSPTRFLKRIVTVEPFRPAVKFASGGVYEPLR